MKKLIVSACAAVIFAANGTEYFAAPNGSDESDCSSEGTAGSFSAAVAKATEAGDIVTLLDGDYDFSGLMPHMANTAIVNVQGPSYYIGNVAITVRSKSGDSSRVRLIGDGTTDGRLFCFNAAAAVQGITITNFYTSVSAAAVYSADAGLLVSNCIIACCSSGKGTGALCNLRLIGSTVLGCAAGAGYSGVGTSINALECDFNDNFCYGNSHGGTGGSLKSSVLTNCRFTGGQMLNYGNNGAVVSDSVLTNCFFLNICDPKCAIVGGSSLYRCHFENCHSSNTLPGSRAGCVFDGTLVECTFSNNTANANYCGVAYDSCAVACEFVSNTLQCTANYGGGGACYKGTAHDCIFIGNSVTTMGYGGAVHTMTVVSNCTFVGNIGKSSGVAYVAASVCSTMFIDCVFSNNTSEAGSAICYGGGEFFRCTVVKNTAMAGIEGMFTDGRLAECVVLGNTLVGSNWGGGGVCMVRGSALNTSFIGNTMSSFGNKGLFSGVALTNCLVAANSCGGYVGFNDTVCVNCTLVDNKDCTSLTAGAMANCVILGNAGADLTGGNVIQCCYYGTTKSAVSDLGGSVGGCTAADLRFESLDLADSGNYYRPKRLSPLVNNGTTIAGFAVDATDLAGNSRVVGQIDVGCYEYQPIFGLSIFVR